MKTLALIAHDGKKAEMMAFAISNREELQSYHLVATESTGQLLQEKAGLEVECLSQGPKGGDAQIGARVVEKRVDAVIFIIDPLDKHPHDPDIQTLLRLCNVHNVPLATNVATAELVLGVNSGQVGGVSNMRQISDESAANH
jgi:methylglyoxal synthase